MTILPSTMTKGEGLCSDHSEAVKAYIVSNVPVFYLYHSLEEACKYEEQLEKSGLQYLRFQAAAVVFDAPINILRESEVIIRLREHSNPFSANEYFFSSTNSFPIKVPFDADEFEEFLLALALMKNHKDLSTFSVLSLCSVLKVADYFECPNLMRLIYSHLNKHLSQKSPSDVCEAFDILSDFTQLQKQQMEREGLWNFNSSS
ncbi:Skp1 domain-containing protein [Trichostrongylus colubriformis]|uniref:Skp1 domain-containing protein n=1 Tax=Trichostrongylus colubriformis TaxID=6319 RepID=A0AAN8FT62_TRICO